MKSVDFLKLLKKQEKLSLIESSDIVSKSYVEKSESNLESAKILLENNDLLHAMNGVVSNRSVNHF